MSEEHTQVYKSMKEAILAAIRETAAEGGGAVWVHTDSCKDFDQGEECGCNPRRIEVPGGALIT